MTDVRLEVASENNVLEILYDGHEIRQPPLSMSEMLSQNARKIEFGSSENGGGDEVSGRIGDDADDIEDDEDDEKPFQQQHWPLESVRNKIRNAYTEVCVLHDLLQIVKDKKYLVLDTITSQPPPPKQYIQFLSLKKSLSCAAGILTSGAERIRNSQTGYIPRPSTDFHMELLRLRQNWRLKRVATNIVGDLAFTSSAMKFKHSGLFEVCKTADDTLSGNCSSPAPVAATPLPGATPRQTAALRVTIPPDLQGSAYIFVTVRKDAEVECSAQLDMLSYGHPAGEPPASPAACVGTVLGATVGGVGASGSSCPDTHWQQKLEAAQNVLFCKELFSQLSREAVTIKMNIPPIVMGEQITATLFPGIHLVIALCLSHTDRHRAFDGPPGELSSSSSRHMTNAHDSVLEHSLHQLMHDFIRKSTPLPHPVYAPLLAHPTRRVAGPHGLDRQELTEAVMTETLLERVIAEAQHNFLRMRTMFVIDQLALELRDSLIISHWSVLNSPKQASVRINIVTAPSVIEHNQDSAARATLLVHVYDKSLRCVCRDGRVMNLSFEPQELRNLLLCQVAQHQMSAVQGLGRLMGWTVSCSEPYLGVGANEVLGSASAVVLTSPAGNKQLMVRSGPCTGISVWVSTAPRNDFYPSAVVRERRWEQLPGAWQEVRLQAIHETKFLAKIELLMASLTAQN